MSSAGFEPLESLPPARRKIAAALLAQGTDRSDIEEMLADYAHELAEEIREERDHIREEKKDPRVGITQEALDWMSYAANLIDPQGHEGVRPDEEPTP
ncbi:hypothetical protein [Streptomyces chartreusis]|uniref:hypothetical protein n=1 Tax=Streptomyces chartreusis TaxID=1969 RepID=UPI0035DE1092